MYCAVVRWFGNIVFGETMKRLGILLGLVALSVWHFVSKKDLPTKVRTIDTLLTKYCELNKLSGTVLVAHNGDIVLQKGYGFQDWDSKTPNSSDTLYRIYSVTKGITSTVVFKLIESNKLSLSDRLSKFYPSIPHAEDITIEHLLSHTSGIFDYLQDKHIQKTMNPT
jgi:CubicO group peptidase (beta-lactamase class C family)